MNSSKSLRLAATTVLAVFLAMVPLNSSHGEGGDALPPVEVSFRTFLLDGSLAGQHLNIRTPDGGFSPVATSVTNYLDSVYTYEGPNPLVFYLDGQVVARVQVPEDMVEGIFLFKETQVAEGEVPQFHVIPIHAEVERFPLGSYLCLNYSGKHLEIQVADQELSLPPATRDTIRLSGDKERAIAARFFVIEEGQKVRASQQAWYFQPDVRKMVILTRDNDIDRGLRIHTVTDRTLKPLVTE